VFWKRKNDRDLLKENKDLKEQVKGGMLILVEIGKQAGFSLI